MAGFAEAFTDNIEFAVSVLRILDSVAIVLVPSLRRVRAKDHGGFVEVHLGQIRAELIRVLPVVLRVGHVEDTYRDSHLPRRLTYPEKAA